MMLKLKPLPKIEHWPYEKGNESVNPVYPKTPSWSKNNVATPYFT